MFIKAYQNKSDNELIEILNSDAYQLDAREAAKKTLHQRGISNAITDDSLKLKKLSIYEISEKLKTFNLSVITSIKKERIEITKNNHGFAASVIAAIIGFFLLALFINPHFFELFEDSFSKIYLRQQISLGIMVCFTGSFMIMKKDSLTIIKFDFKKNNLQVITKRRTKRETQNLKLSGAKISMKELGQKKIQLNLKSSKGTIELIKIKDNNVGNKSESLLSVFTQKINGKIKTFANNA